MCLTQLQEYTATNFKLTMNFLFVPVAEASVISLVNSINKVIINPLIVFLFILATVYFVWGLVEYFINPGSKDVKENSSNKMVYGIIGMFIMVVVYGILNVYLKTIGEDRIQVDRDGGEYKVESMIE